METPDDSYHSLPCLICGGTTYLQCKSWLNDIRAIYTLGHDWSTARCSGIGRRRDIDDNIPKVPEDYNCNSNHRSVKLTNQDLVAVKTPYPHIETSSPIVDGDSDFDVIGNEPWGFLVHDACWRLLQTARPLSADDIKLLSGMCRSCINISVPDFGHDYGGLFQTERTVRPPGENCRGPISIDYMNRLQLKISFCDPLKAQALKRLVQKSIVRKNKSRKISKPPRQGSMRVSRPRTGERLSSLPTELLTQVMLYLSSGDVLNLKLASREFACLPLSQEFWASRFAPDGEKRYIFEANEIDKRGRPRDWRSIFTGLQTLSGDLNFMNRRRIWLIVQSLSSILSRYSGVVLCGDLFPTIYEPDLIPSVSVSRWHHGGGATTLHKTIVRPGGCTWFYSRTITLQPCLAGMFVSLVDLYGTDYVTGLQFVFENGECASLGYLWPGKSVYVDISSSPGTGGRNLIGFQLAVSLRGITGIAGITASGKITHWAGSYACSPRMLLVASRAVHHVRGNFDELKMTTLCIPSDDTRNSLEQDPAIIARESMRSCNPLPGRLSIRNTCAWFPHLPPAGVFLNEKYYKGTAQACLREFPVHITMFGGSQGADISKLVGVTGWTLDSLHVLGIRFEYRDQNGNTFHREFGRCGPFTVKEYFDMEATVDLREIDSNDEPMSDEDATRDEENFNQNFHLDIDGPGGEIITLVGWYARSPNQLKWPGLEVTTAAKIYTNFGRSVVFPPCDGKCRHMPPQQQGAVITGLYGHLDDVTGAISCLGVVSERVP